MTNVLIVEDSFRVRQALVNWLESAFSPCRFLQAADGESALVLTGKWRPAVVLMDLELPGMSGFQATRQIKKLLPEATVIVMTGHEEEEYRRSALAVGARAFVPKSRMFAELLPALTAALSGGAVTIGAASGTIA